MLQTILPAEPYDEAAMADLYYKNKDRECKVWKIACRCQLDLLCPKLSIFQNEFVHLDANDKR